MRLGEVDRGGVARVAEPPARRIWLMAGWGWIGLVVYLTLTASPPDLDLGFEAADKWEHLVAYGWLMGWFAPLYPALRERMWVAAGLALLGVTLEFLQGLGGVRVLEVGDMFANATGVLIALGAWEWIGRR